MDLLVKYLKNGTTPADKKEAKRIKRQALWFVLLDDQLYKKSFFLLLLKGLKPSKSNYVLRKVHEGIYDNHLGGRSLAYKILHQGYY